MNSLFTEESLNRSADVTQFEGFDFFPRFLNTAVLFVSVKKESIFFVLILFLLQKF